MNLNGINSYSQVDAYSAYANAANKTTPAPEADNQVAEDVAAVYEKSEAASSGVTPKTYTPNTALVEQMKADQASLQKQMLSYVQESLMGQGNALASTDDIWKFLASGNFTVDEAARAEAQKSLEEGGYWSVENTATRIVDFAKALTGGDSSKIETMRDAIDKGFKEATKVWGKELPDITKDTYASIQKKLDDWAKESESATTEVAQ